MSSTSEWHMLLKWCQKWSCCCLGNAETWKKRMNWTMCMQLMMQQGLESAWVTTPSKHAWASPEAFWLRPLQPACSQNWARLYIYMPDPTSHIRFSSMEGMDLTVQNWPRSSLDGLVGVWPIASVWKQAGVQESFGLVSGRTQPARYQFPTFRLGSVFPQMSQIILCNTNPDPV